MPLPTDDFCSPADREATACRLSWLSSNDVDEWEDALKDSILETFSATHKGVSVPLRCVLDVACGPDAVNGRRVIGSTTHRTKPLFAARDMKFSVLDKIREILADFKTMHAPHGYCVFSYGDSELRRRPILGFASYAIPNELRVRACSGVFHPESELTGRARRRVNRGRHPYCFTCTIDIDLQSATRVASMILEKTRISLVNSCSLDAEQLFHDVDHQVQQCSQPQVFNVVDRRLFLSLAALESTFKDTVALSITIATLQRDWAKGQEEQRPCPHDWIYEKLTATTTDEETSLLSQRLLSSLVIKNDDDNFVMPVRSLSFFIGSVQSLRPLWTARQHTPVAESK